MRAVDSAWGPRDFFSACPSSPAKSCALPSPCTILDNASQVVFTPLNSSIDSGLTGTFRHSPFSFGPGSSEGNWIGGWSGSAGLLGEAVGELGGAAGVV